MIVLQETTNSQEVKFIPREYQADTIILRNETTDETTTYNITATQSGYYLVVDDVFTLKENNFYFMTVKNGSDIVYRDKIYCTNQVIADYTVNQSEYDNYDSTNDYITYE